tara:strand:+ start:104 stop:376 length:273 start_codon:yes stop_codon:yes gene_type:complete
MEVPKPRTALFASVIPTLLEILCPSPLRRMYGNIQANPTNGGVVTKAATQAELKTVRRRQTHCQEVLCVLPDPTKISKASHPKARNGAAP